MKDELTLRGERIWKDLLEIEEPEEYLSEDSFEVNMERPHFKVTYGSSGY